MLLSLIIPIYNVEKYLRYCIDSVLKQNFSDMEIILVDDGSPDNSGKICDEYAERDNRIKVIHKENGGISSARNEGLRAVKGDYVMFMDSDDYWNEKVSLKEMFETVKANPSTDMFIFSSLDYIEGKGFFIRKEHEVLGNVPTDTVRNCYTALIKNGNIEVSACTKILKKKFLIDNDLFFRDKILSEDSEWTLRLIRVLKNVQIINVPLYICRLKRQGSITNTVGKKNVLDLISVINLSMDFYKTNDSPMKDIELCYVAYLWFCAVGLCIKTKGKDRRELKVGLKKTSSVCKYSNSKKTKLANAVYRIFGFEITTFILGKYIELKDKKR